MLKTDILQEEEKLIEKMQIFISSEKKKKVKVNGK